MPIKKSRTPKTPAGRRLEALRVRNRAAKKAFTRKHPHHKSNREEDDDSLDQFTNFRKGLPHDKEGRVKSADYNKFRQACEGQELRAFEKVNIGTPDAKFRKWESPTAGACYDLEGPDAQAVTMPPAPTLGSGELAAEMAEVYLMALLRDVPFTAYKTNAKVKAAVTALNTMPWFRSKNGRGKVTVDNLFRGQGPGVHDGPLVSQFLLVGTPDITLPKNNAQAMGINSDADGLIEYGAQVIDQRVRTALPECDFMQNFEDWLCVQRGTNIPNIDPAHFAKKGDKLPYRRFVTTARDMATYVHFDQLYQAYLNACLILLASNAGIQHGLPHNKAKHTKGFAQFGGPHILTLVTEVATRALKAVRYQKFTRHRRGRPEQIAGLISQYKKFESATKNPFASMEPLVRNLDNVIFGGRPLLEAINVHNGGHGPFLPMAFPEGSPMHPSYGAGHATVAGACVTALKAFFQTRVNIRDTYVPAPDGRSLKKKNDGKKKLQILGELNKLAANIAIARNMGGVHYYTDYSESLKMGEQIAFGILEEQLFTYPEHVKMVIPPFFGGSDIVLKNG